MKPQQLAPLLLAALFASCNSGGTSGTPVQTSQPLTPAQQQARVEQVKLEFKEPVFIDSSVYVLYPLRLGYTEDEDTDSSIGSKSYSRSNSYWNIAFYNTETGESHLLSTDKRMVIYSYDADKSAVEATTISAAAYAKYAQASVRQLGKRLYYSVRTTDFNNDGLIDERDPNCLFSSDKAGRNFTQISPPGYDVDGWQVLRGANKILLQGRPDTNGDGKFDRDDVATPMVYNFRPDGPAKAVFEAPFLTTAKQLLHNQWANKP